MKTDPADKTGIQAPTVTGLVLTCNGERLLEKCLFSLKFCDSLLLVDSGSSDGTERIATAAGARYIRNEWQGFAAQFTYAATLVETDWFFILDQDEICSAELAASIKQSMAAACGENAPIAFSVGRSSWYFDRFLHHSGWRPDHIPRLFKRGYVRFSQDAHIHYHPDGVCGHISAGDIIHYPYAGFAHQLAKLNMYAEQGAEFLRASAGKGGVLRGIGHGLAKFFRIYVLKAGFLDGRAGFLVAVHGAFYTFLKYVRVLQASWGAPFDHK